MGKRGEKVAEMLPFCLFLGPYTIGVVYRMPRNRDCGYAEIAVPLHPESLINLK